MNDFTGIVSLKCIIMKTVDMNEVMSTYLISKLWMVVSQNNCKHTCLENKTDVGHIILV